MMKKIYKVLFSLLCVFFMISSVNAKTLKQLRDELKKDEARQAQLIAEQKAKQKKIDAANKEIGSLAGQINSKENKVEAAKTEIEELEGQIEEKKKEIDNLLSFLQISSKENVYLEYVFQAKDFTDFIYRSAVVEQLTAYNDQLIDEMYKMIEDNKALQIKLKKEINNAEKSINDLERVLRKYGLDMSDIDKNQKDIKADIKARKVEIAEYEKVYKANKCDENVEITKCVDVPPAGELVRPLKSGRITSNYGMYDPWNNGSWRMHNGMDIGGNSPGTYVYAPATGTVAWVSYHQSCGGNIVYIHHQVGGKAYTSEFGHLRSYAVSPGQKVVKGQIIGYVGGDSSTWYYDKCTSGTHLHYSIAYGYYLGAGANGYKSWSTFKSNTRATADSSITGIKNVYGTKWSSR